MTKKIAVINDLSGFGRCSLTAAISVLSVMGIQPVALPTAILSSQTEYDSYYCDDYTDKMKYFREEWKKLNPHFDGIYTGYLASLAQIEEIFRFLEQFGTPDTFLLVDPVMGDDGIPYDMYSEAFCGQMKALVRRADIITPNLTELALLTDTDIHELQSLTDTGQFFDAVRQLGEKLCASGTKAVLVTGILYPDADGKTLVGNLYISPDTCVLHSAPYLHGSYSGTGDLFSSCVAGALVRGASVPDSIPVISDFLGRAIADTAREGTPFNDGVNYEKYLSMLINI